MSVKKSWIFPFISILIVILWQVFVLSLKFVNIEGSSYLGQIMPKLSNNVLYFYDDYTFLLIGKQYYSFLIGYWNSENAIIIFRLIIPSEVDSFVLSWLSLSNGVRSFGSRLSTSIRLLENPTQLTESLFSFQVILASWMKIGISQWFHLNIIVLYQFLIWIGAQVLHLRSTSVYTLYEVIIKLHNMRVQWNSPRRFNYIKDNNQIWL